MYEIRRKYAAGGDVWLADAPDEYVARQLAIGASEHFAHGAVYVRKLVGPTGAVIACYVGGLRSSWAWWSGVATLRNGAALPGLRPIGEVLRPTLDDLADRALKRIGEAPSPHPKLLAEHIQHAEGRIYAAIQGDMLEP